MSQSPYHMWTYWREKKGLRAAIEDYYPEEMNNPEIRMALFQIETGVTAIENYFKNKADKEVDEDDR